MPLNRHGQLTVWRDIERVGGKTPHQKSPACWTACPTVPYSQERRAPRRQHREHDNRHVPSIKIEVVHTNGWFESPALPGSTFVTELLEPMTEGTRQIGNPWTW